MALATLSVDLVARLAKFETDMGKAARASEAASQRISRSLGVIKAGFAGLIAGLSVRELVGAFSSIVDAADELGKLSQRTGIAVETLGGLGFAAAKAGGDVIGITNAADKLNRSLAEAASGEKLASEAFAALGLSAVDAAGKTKTVDVAMAEIADKFASFADGPEKVAIAMRLFGKAGADQIVLLNGGGEAIRKATEYYQKYSGVTEDMTKKAEVFNDTLSDIQLIASGVGTRLTIALLPALQAVADQLLRIQESGGGFSGLGEKIGAAFNFIADKAAYGVLAMRAWITWFTALKDIATSPLTAKTTIGRIRDELVAAYKDMQRFQQALAGIGVPQAGDESEAERRRLGLSKPRATKANAPRLPPSTSSGGRSSTKQDKELDLTNKALARYLEQLDSTIQRTQELTAVEEARIFLGKQQGVSDKDAEQVLSLARRIDTEKALKEATQDRIDSELDAMRRVDEANEQYQSRLKSLTDSAATNVFKRQADDLQFLIDALAKGDVSLQVYNESVDNLFNVTEEKMEKTKSLAEELGLTFTSAFEDAIVGGKKFSDILKGLEKDIIRMVTRDQVTKPLADYVGKVFKGDGSGDSGIGGFFTKLFGSLLSFDGGGSTGNGPRSGGLDGKGGFMAMMHPQETVTDHTKGGGRNVIVTINQSFAPGTSRQTTMQAAVDAQRALQRGARGL